MLREVGRDLQKRIRTNSPFNASGNEKWNAAQQLIVAFEASNECLKHTTSRPNPAGRHRHARTYAARRLTPSLVLTPQVNLESVVGIDWSRPLVHDGRVVLEARAVVKRIFRSVSKRLECCSAVTPAEKVRHPGAEAD